MKTFVFLILPVFILISCKEKFPGEVEARFEIPLKVSPHKETFRLSQDTIWVEFNFPDTIYERETKKFYKFETFDFKTRMAVFKLKQGYFIAEQEGALPYFTVVNKEGTLENKRLTFCYLTFEHKNSHYLAKLGLVPNDSGIYTLLFDSRYSTFSGAPKADVSFIDMGGRYVNLHAFYYIVNQGKTNYDLLKSNVKIAYEVSPSESNQVLEQLSTFTFKVE